MAESRKKDLLCPFHRAEATVDDLCAEWRAKAAELSPQAARAVAQSLRAVRNVLDSCLLDIEKKERAGGETVHVPVKPDSDE